MRCLHEKAGFGVSSLEEDKDIVFFMIDIMTGWKAMQKMLR
jgi:hypothetical protein